LECEINQQKYQTVKQSFYNFDQTQGLPEVLTATGRGEEKRSEWNRTEVQDGVSNFSPSSQFNSFSKRPKYVNAQATPVTPT